MSCNGRRLARYSSAWPITTIVIALFLSNGCDQAGGLTLKRSWHDKHHWVAQDYFNDPQVIALCEAIRANDLDAIRRLIREGANVNALGKGNMTPLLWAFPDNKIDRFRLLLENGANPNVYIESNLGVPNAFQAGDSVTHMVCRTYFEYFDAVFDHGGDVNFPSKVPMNVGETPIFTLIRYGGPDKRQKLKKLIDKGADISLCVETTPAILSTSFGGQYELTLQLLEAGADYRVYQSDGIQRLVHIVSKADELLLRTAGPQQRADYDRLVDWLERHGESIDEAKADRARWAKWSDNFTDHRAREIAERKRREQQAAAKPKAAD
jgi:hypothetical protein